MSDWGVRGGQAWGWMGEITAGWRDYAGGWIREKKMTEERVWKCGTSARWGGREEAMLKGDVSLCRCTGFRNSSSTRLSWAPWLKNTTEANVVLAGRKAVRSPGPYPLLGETRSNRLELQQGCCSSGFGKPLVAAGKVILWKALPGKTGAPPSLALFRNRPGSIYWNWIWYALSWFWGLMTLLRSFSVIKQEQRGDNSENI